MKEISITLNPVYWRLITWRIFPILAAIIITALISVVAPTNSFIKVFSIRLLPYFLGMLIAGVCFSHIEWFKKKLSIEITEEKISGSKTGTGLFNRRQIFLVKELERTNLLQKGSYQKYFGMHKLCSTRGEVIIFTPFVYERNLVDEFYKTLETILDENLKNKKQKAIDWREK